MPAPAVYFVAAITTVAAVAAFKVVRQVPVHASESV